MSLRLPNQLDESRGGAENVGEIIGGEEPQLLTIIIKTSSQFRRLNHPVGSAESVVRVAVSK